MSIWDIELHKKWKDKYIVDWCDLCRTATIRCSDCKNSSCNGGGCPNCLDDFVEFNHQCKTSVENYLTEEEVKIYHKCLQLKKFIIKTLRNGDKEINWLELDKRGELSKYDRQFFIEKQ